MSVMVVKYLILFTVVKLVYMMAMVGVTVRVVMEIVTMLMLAVVPMAFICISVGVIKQCVPTTQQHRKLRNFNNVFASLIIKCTDNSTFITTSRICMIDFKTRHNKQSCVHQQPLFCNGK